MNKIIGNKVAILTNLSVLLSLAIGWAGEPLGWSSVITVALSSFFLGVGIGGIILYLSIKKFVKE